MTCVVVVPIYRSVLTDVEKAVLAHCVRVLSAYDIVIIGPESLDHGAIDSTLGFEAFEDTYFDGIEGYNSLMLSSDFYSRFVGYDFVLIHQLDAWVFRDELLQWCAKGYSYIGAPWIEKPQLDSKPIFDLTRFMVNRVGNGGFSLRSIADHLQVLKRYEGLGKFFKKNEDLFWSIVAPKLMRCYKIPKVQEAIAFAFELKPSVLYELNGRQLPFGCHAWEKYEPEFWSDYIHVEV